MDAHPFPPELEPEVRLLNAISRTLAAAGSPADVMRLCLKALCPVIGARCGLVLTLDLGGSSLEVMAAFGIVQADQSNVGSAFGGATAIERVQEAFKSGCPVVAEAGPWSGSGSTESEASGVGRTVFLPLQLEGTVLLGGVVLGLAGPAVSSEGELRLLWACAEQMAIAYHVARDRQDLKEALKRSQELQVALQENSATLRAIVDNSYDDILIKDVNGVFKFANLVAARAWGLDPEALGDVSEVALFGPEVAEVIREAERRVIAERRAIVFEYGLPVAGEGERIDGERIKESCKVPLFDSAGNIEGVLTIAHDITARIERDRMQQTQIAKLEELDRLKDHFLSAASHELRTPLSSIMGFAEFLEDEIDGSLSPSQKDYVRNIQAGAEQLQRLVADMLDFARLKAGTFGFNFKSVDLVDTIRDVVARLRPLALKAGMALETELPEQPCEFPIDPDRISQVCQNLIGNAIKFTPTGGRIAVDLADRGDRVMVRVRDSGVGIDRAHIPMLFQRFYQADTGTTREHGGAGLGLSIAKALVEGHGGEIGVDSVPGEGSTFWFTLSKRMAQLGEA